MASSSSQQPATVEVIAKIEAVFKNITDSLLSEENPRVPKNDIFVRIKYKKRTTSNDEPALPNAEPSQEFKDVCWPAMGRPREAWRFTVLVRILGLILDALYDNVIISKRNIYYKDPELFENSSVVDRNINILAYTFGVSRLALHVTAAAKGLVAGKLTVTMNDGTQACREPDKPHLVDDPHDIQAIDISGTAWILVVEKEASSYSRALLSFPPLVPSSRSLVHANESQSTFRTLASGHLHQSSRAGKGLIITAKGYPDISTRFFLRLLSTSHDKDSLPPPLYALTDFDPDGLAIMSTYKHGSRNNSHENPSLTVPSIQWLGVQSQDVLPGDGQYGYSNLLRLTARDRKKAADMLKRSNGLQEAGLEKEWRRELQVMLMLNVKAEMEILAEREGGVRRWVEEKLEENCPSLQADEDLLETHELESLTLNEKDESQGMQRPDEMLDEHSAVGEGSASSQADEEDENLFDSDWMADVPLANEDSPDWDEEL